MAALVSVVLIPSIAFPQSSFTDPIYIKTPRQGTLLVSGNFGYDSQIDLAYWTPHPDLDLYVWYKNGDGDFTKSVIPVDDVATLKAMKVGDFNADGYDDIIAIETMTNDTKVLLFTSNGASFTQKTIATAPGLAESIQVVKFNDDEHLDLLMSFTNADLISYLGNGSGTFTAETVTGTTSLRSFRHVDLNNDDRLDFVGLNNTTLKIFLKSETGYTASEKILSDTPFDFEVADFDGDDFVDVAVSFFTNSSGRIDIYKNAGDATFPASQTLAAGQQPYLFAQADYDNDGRQDLAASSFNSPSVLIFNNTPGGFMSYGPTQTKGNASTGIIFADTNDDNIRELVELRQQEINIYTRSNSGVFVLDETIILALFPNSGEVVDINDDQFNDIVAPSSKGIGVMYGQPNFSFSEPVYTQTVGDLQPAISIADFNNDNLKD
ncbi:MAG TPA: VCBS repeat-containing protein, partial [Cyclobacteriaceae bacterium]|nr:VCBS repeat-containing protein [Cyclobacteriaceae bacterium]